MGTKAEPGRFDGYGKAEPDEPIFTLLGRDPAAPKLIRAWVFEHQNAKTDGVQLMEALAVADEMDQYLIARNKRVTAPVIETED